MAAEVVRPLVSRAVRADFEGFYSHYHPHVLGYVRRVFGPADAEDVAQETMARACAYFDRLEPGRDPWPWLCVVSRNIATDLIRERSRAVSVDDQRLADLAADEAEAPFAQLVAWDERRTLSRALARLRPLDRRVLLLREYDDLSIADIATLLERSEIAVRQQLSRARRRLAEQYRAVTGRVSGFAPWVVLVAAVRRSRRALAPAAGAGATSGIVATTSLLAITGAVIAVGGAGAPARHLALRPEPTLVLRGEQRPTTPSVPPRSVTWPTTWGVAEAPLPSTTRGGGAVDADPPQLPPGDPRHPGSKKKTPVAELPVAEFVLDQARRVNEPVCTGNVLGC